MYRHTLWITVAIVAVAMLAMPANAAISGSAHDFSADAWNTTTEICVVCHTPHNADTSVTESPLWNHEVTTSTYSPYEGTDMEQVVPQPGGISKLCLSCHDGTVALDNFGGTTTGTNFVPGTANVGIDLRDDHPVSISYDTSAATDTELNAVGGLSTNITLFGAGNNVECASCHDVHNTVSAGNSKLLVIDNTGSDLCLECHAK